MEKFINAFTGTEMWVADERVEEYKAAGHRLAAVSSNATEPAKEPAKKPVKKTTKATKK